MITLIIFATAAYALILLRTNKGAFCFSPSGIHFAYLMLYVVIPAISLYTYDLPHFFGRGISFYISEKALAAILLAIVGFAGGALITGKGKEKQVSLKPDLYRCNFGSFLFLALLLTSIFLGPNFKSLTLLDSPLALGDPDHYANMQEWKAEAMNGSTYLLQGIHNIIPFIALFVLARYYCGEGKGHRNWATALIAFDVLVEFATGGLWVGFALLVMALLLRQYFRPATRKQVLMVGTLLCLVVAGSLLLKFGGLSVEKDSEDTMQLVAMSGQRFASGAATIELILETYPQHGGYEYGLTYVRDAVSLIPSPIKRQILPERWWGGFNALVAGDLGFYGGTGQIPVMAEFYANFGSVGILLGCLAYGIILQKVSNILRARSIRKASTTVFVAILGYRLAEATVEGVGGRFPISCLWVAIFFFYLEVARPGMARPLSDGARYLAHDPS